jgi:hypothetical protein
MSFTSSAWYPSASWLNLSLCACILDVTLVFIISGSSSSAFHAINISCSWGFDTRSVAVLDAACLGLADLNFSHGVDLGDVVAAELNSHSP